MASSTTDRTIAVAQARFAIEDILYRYAEAIDGADMETVGSIFRHGAVVSLDGTRVEGYQRALELYRDLIIFYDANEQPTDYVRGKVSPRTRHVTTNVIYAFDEDVARADVRSYFSVYQTIAQHNEIIAGGRYEDRFENGAEGWCIKERRILLENLGDMSRHLHHRL